MSDIRNQSCKHFTGLMDKVCSKGIEYAPLRDVDGPGMAVWPCLGAASHRPCKFTCEHFELHTAEEIAEQDRELAKILTGLMDFEKRETEACPHCGKHVSQLQQVGRCVYARPCNCRVWQGRIPKAWKA